MSDNFDPDKYLAEKETEAFDPDAYLAEDKAPVIAEPLSDLPVEAISEATPALATGGSMYAGQKGLEALLNPDRLKGAAESMAYRSIGGESTAAGKKFLKDIAPYDAPFISERDIGRAALDQGMTGFTGADTAYETAQKKMSLSNKEIEQLLEETQKAKELKKLPKTSIEDIVKSYESSLAQTVDPASEKGREAFKYAKKDLEALQELATQRPINVPGVLDPNAPEIMAGMSLERTPQQLEKLKREIPFETFQDTAGAGYAKQMKKKALKEAVETDVLSGLGEEGLEKFKGLKKQSGTAGIMSDILLQKSLKDATKAGADLTDIATAGVVGIPGAIARKGIKQYGAGVAAKGLDVLSDVADTVKEASGPLAKAAKGVYKALPFVGAAATYGSAKAQGSSDIEALGKTAVEEVSDLVTGTAGIALGSEEVGKGSDFTKEEIKQRIQKSIEKQAQELKGTPAGNALNAISKETRPLVKEMLLKNLQQEYPEISIADVKMNDDTKVPKYMSDDDIIDHLAKSEGSALNADSSRIIVPGATGIYDDGKGNPTTMFGANLRSPVTRQAYKELGIDPTNATEEQHKQAAVYNWKLHSRYSDKALDQMGLSLEKTNPQEAEIARFVLRDIGYRGGVKSYNSPIVADMISKLNSGDYRGFANDYLKTNHFKTGGEPRQRELLNKLKELIKLQKGNLLRVD